MKVKTQPQSTGKRSIDYRVLGKTGIRIPIISMGVMNTLDPVLVERSYEKGMMLYLNIHVSHSKNKKFFSLEGTSAHNYVIGWISSRTGFLCVY